MFDFLKSKTSIESSGLLSAHEDAHSHILYGVDDGISSLKSALAVLSYEESLGVASVCCTPHIMEDVPNTTDELKRRFEDLLSAYNGKMELKLAAEYMIDNLFIERLKAKDLLLWGKDMVLVETSSVMPPINLRVVFSELMMSGYTPLLAHPERYRYLKEEDYLEFAESGVKYQLNLPSLVGRFGPTAKESALWLLDKGLYSAYGSDCHRLEAIKKHYSAKELSAKTVEKLKDTSLLRF